jgi:hypothetical protein
MTRLVIAEGSARFVTILVLMAVAFLLHALAKSQIPKDESDPVRLRRRGLKGLVIGSDGRASTSKLQALLWTFAIFYALTFLLLWGRSIGCTADSTDVRCLEAGRALGAFSRVLDEGLQPEYYVLLGFPYAAAIAAKAMTSAKVADETIDKKEIEPDHKGFGKGVGEIVANDQGESDLVDFQYFAFNLLALTFFFVEFLGDPASGLPELPPTLIALAGLSTASYAAKKALETGAWERKSSSPGVTGAPKPENGTEG